MFSLRFKGIESPPKKAKKRSRPSDRANPLTSEDAEIISSLDAVTKDLLFAHKCFDLASSDILIDSFIFEIQSLNKRHEYYIKLCKERGLIAECVKS